MNRNEVPAIIGYCRVSSREQSKNSAALDQQIAHVQEAGAEEVLGDVESGRSGREEDRMIWLLQCGQPTAEAAEVTGYSQAWVYELVRSDNEQGPSALGDQRQQNRGHGHSILDNEMQALLWQALQTEPPEGGHWHGRKVADWLSERLERPSRI